MVQPGRTRNLLEVGSKWTRVSSRSRTRVYSQREVVLGGSKYNASGYLTLGGLADMLECWFSL